MSGQKLEASPESASLAEQWMAMVWSTVYVPALPEKPTVGGVRSIRTVAVAASDWFPDLSVAVQDTVWVPSPATGTTPEAVSFDPMPEAWDSVTPEPSSEQSIDWMTPAPVPLSSAETVTFTGEASSASNQPLAPW